jgi:hypothetical protein
VVKFFEYDGEVILDADSDWDTIMRGILKDLHILEDYQHGLSDPKKSIDSLEEELLQQNLFKSVSLSFLCLLDPSLQVVCPR